MCRSRTYLAFMLCLVGLLVCLGRSVLAEGAPTRRQAGPLWQARRLAEGGPVRATSLTHLAGRAGMSIVDFDLSQDAIEENLPEIMFSLGDTFCGGQLGPGSQRWFLYRIVRPIGGTSAEKAYMAMIDDALLDGVALIFLDADIVGTERRIYDSLTRRKFRATTGPDEGIDASDVPYCPRCIFVPSDDASVISVASWRGIFLHENRHLVQLAHNPSLADDFREDDGRFTTYAAFCEACADDGLFTTPIYHARERMAQLREMVGAENEALISRACRGDKAAYAMLEEVYDGLAKSPGAFADLFRPYW